MFRKPPPRSFYVRFSVRNGCREQRAELKCVDYGSASADSHFRMAAVASFFWFTCFELCSTSGGAAR
jgi:hypothetical protein